MDVRSFCAQSRVLVVAGKGGVGKTTMAAALARMAADAGLSVLVVELEGRTGMSSAFGHATALAYDATVLSAAGATEVEDGTDPPAGAVPPGTVHARMVTPDDALLEYLADHGMKRISKRLVSSGVIDVVSSAIPGIRDILVLGKIKQLERDRVADLIVVDAPATGHAMTFLSSASGLLAAARGGPVRAQAADVVELLTDPARCQVVLVTLPEEMPVNEAIEAAYRLEDEVGVALGPVIVNGIQEPPGGPGLAAAPAAARAGVVLDEARIAALDDAWAFRHSRVALQAAQASRLGAELPLAQLHAPFVFSATIGPAELERLARALAMGVAAIPQQQPVAP
jgi:anion-transporting  ArsA/GET3 family ATPase